MIITSLIYDDIRFILFMRNDYNNIDIINSRV